MISIDNLTKSYGAQMLFDNTGVRLNRRERVGLVGRNGFGKTTLFKIIAGLEPYDAGSLSVPRNYRIGYVSQQLEFSEETILDEAMSGFTRRREENAWKAERILFGLGFNKEDMDRSPGEFSGGFQVRLNLAKSLLAEPDLLLLDEPTNYLDITSIRWIKNFLINWPSELMLITHDRGFMDSVVTHTVGIYQKKLRKIKGDTGKFYSQVAQEEEINEKTRANQERRQKEMQLFIDRFRAKARLAGLVQSRIKTLEKTEVKEKAEVLKTLSFSFKSKPFPSKYVMTVKNLSFSYVPDIPLIRDLNITLAAGERICVVGKNGKGKTTLLKILAGFQKSREGEISYNPNVEKGFYEQTNIKTLNDGNSIFEEILHSSDNIDMQQARNICGAMLFEGDAALKKIEVLSGGEKSRVMLGKLLTTPVNLLILDEPTNHLDMESCDAMLAALDNFTGAVIMVTHNEMFLHALAQRLVVFQKDGPSVFEGTYGEFLDKVGWEEEDVSPAKKGSNNGGAGEKLTKKELKRRRSEIISARAKTVKPLEDRIAEIENEIESFEGKLATLTAEMQNASQAGDGKKIGELGQTIHVCQSAIDRLFEELETVSDKFTEKKTLFDKELEELESRFESAAS